MKKEEERMVGRKKEIMERKILKKLKILPLVLKTILKCWIKATQDNYSLSEIRALPFKVTAFNQPTCICLEELSHGY